MTTTTTNALTGNYISMIVMILFWPIFLWTPVFTAAWNAILGAYIAVWVAFVLLWNGAGSVILTFSRLCVNLLLGALTGIPLWIISIPTAIVLSVWVPDNLQWIYVY